MLEKKLEAGGWIYFQFLASSILSSFKFLPSSFQYRLGDFSDRVPPLSIPNREVKPVSAEDTPFGGKLVIAKAFD